MKSKIISVIKDKEVSREAKIKLIALFVSVLWLMICVIAITIFNIIHSPKDFGTIFPEKTRDIVAATALAPMLFTAIWLTTDRFRNGKFTREIVDSIKNPFLKE